MKQTGLTLLEIMIVVIVIGLLATLTIPHFGWRRERSLDDEAEAGLKQMNAAEKFYHLEHAENYYPATDSQTDISSINLNLKLDLREDSWDYLCTDSGCVQATRKDAGARTWRMCIDEPEPVADQTCSTCP